MCWQKNSDGLAAPPGSELFPRSLPGERAACLSCGAGGNLDLPLPQRAGAENGPADADAGDRANPGPLWLPQSPGAAEPGRMESGQETGVPPVSRGRLNPAAQATAEAPRVAATTRTMPAAAPNQVWSLAFVADQL